MSMPRLTLPVLLAAASATVVHAQSEPPSHFDEGAAGHRPGLVSPDTTALPGRYSRDGYERPEPMRGSEPNPALERFDPREQREFMRNRSSMPGEISQDLHSAIEQAQRVHGGKVLSADRMRSEGRDVYRVKLLTPSGRVRVVQLQKRDSTPAPSERDQQGEQ